jgi:HEAT repeat protein
MRLQAALAARGDAQAAAELRAASASGTSDCDKEDMEVRAEALNALAQLNPPEARPTLKRVLARRDACSTTLRRRAVYILGRAGTEESVADLLEVARADSDYGVRTDAIMMLGRAPGPSTVKTLEQIFSDNNDQRIRSAVLQALRANDGPEARRVIKAIIERSDVPEQTRADAIGSLVQGFTYVATTGGGGGAVASRGSRADDEDAVWLRGLYGKTDSRAIKRAIISASSRIGGAANDQWILGIAKNRDEDVTLRREALSRLKTSSLSVDDLGKLFDALSERELRGAILGRLAEREDSAATDKLIEIAKSGTDPQLRRMAISALARKKDPRTTKLLLDLLEKP